jgi:dephospho-CoA kinase
MFKKWLYFIEQQQKKKAVILLGGPACGKSFIINQFKNQGFAIVSLDNFFEPMIEKIYPGKKIYVSAKNPQMKSLYIQAANQADNLIQKYLQENIPFVTEKTGQFWNTTINLKKLIESYGFTPFAIFIHCDPDLAWQRNVNRKRVLQDKDEFMDIHTKAKLNLIPSQKNINVIGFRNLFGENFFEVNNDGTPENNKNIQDTISRIVTA